jgi:hypothetical protein
LIDKLDGDGAHQGALAIYQAILTLADADMSGFWDRSMPVEVRAEARAVLDGVIEKLLTLSMQEQLARIVRTAPDRRRP